MPGLRAGTRVGGEHSAREPAGSCSRPPHCSRTNLAPLTDRSPLGSSRAGPFAARPRDPASGQGVPIAPLFPGWPASPPWRAPRSPHLPQPSPSAARHFLTFRRRERPGPGRVMKLC